MRLTLGHALKREGRPLSEDLGKAFPDMHGFRPRQLKYMSAFAET